MKKALVVGLLLAGAILGIAAEAASDDGEMIVQLSLRGWFAKVDTRTDLFDDILDSGKLNDFLKPSQHVSPGADLRVQVAKRHTLELRYLYLSTSDKRFTINPSVFKDIPSLLGSQLEGDLTLHYAKAGWRWAIVRTESGVFKMETIVDAAGGVAKGTYNHYRSWWPFNADAKGHADIQGVLPVVGLGVTVTPARWLDIFLEASGMTAAKYGDLLDYEAGLRIMPFRWLGIEGGYRGLIIDNKDDAKFTVMGPFAGAVLRF